MTHLSYSFDAGALVTLSYETSGNQQGCCYTSDDVFAGFLFNAPTNINHVTYDGEDDGTFPIPGDIIRNVTGFPLLPDSPRTLHTYSFVATEAGSVHALFGSDNFELPGPLLDNVNLSIVEGGVPEPASWALMIMGFGLAGACLRRRRALIV